MWQGGSPKGQCRQQVCGGGGGSGGVVGSGGRDEPCPGGGLLTRRCAPQSPPHSRRPLLSFPPPPAYPPPHHHHHQHQQQQDLAIAGPSNASTDHFRMFASPQTPVHDLDEICVMDEEMLSRPGPSRQCFPQPSTSWASADMLPNDYSYAYYEPGPPTKHTNVPCNHPITGYRDRASRHMYLTRYGTEENIYEEISEGARARMLRNPHHHRHHHHQHSVLSLSQSIVEEEVRRVQHRHHKILGELNLSVEAMLMPNSSSQEEDTDKEMDDQLADLLTVGPTDELLSPAPPPVDMDSGFSGSSSGTSYVGSMRRAPERFKNQSSKNSANSSSNSSNSASTKTEHNTSKSFWSRKGWRKIPGLSSLGSSKSSSHNGKFFQFLKSWFTWSSYVSSENRSKCGADAYNSRSTIV